MKHTMKHLFKSAKIGFLGAVLALGSPHFASAAQSSPGSGDIAIYTHSTGGGAITTADFTHDFDTDDRQDAETFSRSGTDVTLNRAGHYLAIYNSQFNSSGTAGTELRVEVQSNLMLGGAPLASGWSQGFIRRQEGQDETITAGMSVFEANAADVLQLRSFRTDTSAPSNVTRAAAATGLQLIKLDDVNMNFARLSLGANQAGPTTATWVKVPYDTDDELDAGFTHGSSGDLTLVNGGKYLVVANTYVTGPNNRTSLVQRLTLDNTEVAGSKTTVYLRGSPQQNTQNGSASIGMIIDAAAGQVLRVEGSLDVNNSTTFNADRCALTVIELPSAAQGTGAVDPEYVRLRNETDQNVNAATDTALVFGIQDEVDSAFAHTVAGSAVTVNTDGDYLFLGSVYDNDDQVPRSFFSQGWSVNGGSKAAQGRTGRYSRNTEGADQLGNSSGFIGSGLLASDSVEMVSSALGRAGVNNANRVSLQGVNLASLFTTTASFEVIIDPLLIAVEEGGATATYDLSLGLAPGAGSVEITVTADADTEVSLDGTNFSPTVTPSFTAGGTPQTITVRALDDGDVESDHVAAISHAITATGDAVNYPTSLTITDVTVNVTDNDVVAVVAVDDTSISNLSEDAIGTEVLTGNLLANDTGGFNNMISASDSTSAFGAAVNVNSDGTFTYDPTGAAGAQTLAAGDSEVDTFSYTVTDEEGNSDSATVSITIEGANDAPEAMTDRLFVGPLESASSFVSTTDLTSNDGPFRTITTDYTFPPGSDLRFFPDKVVTQSPSLGVPPGGGVPERAFDGNVGTFTHTDSNDNTVDHTWQVDFGQEVSMENVTLANRADCCGERLRDITVTVLDGAGAEIFNSGLLNPANTLGFTGNSGGTLFVDFAGPIMGQTLIVTRTPDLADANVGNGSILSLGEVTLIGSVPGTFSETQDFLLLNYEASRTAGAGRWENTGTSGGSNADWELTDVTLDSSPVTTRAQISAAYEWDNLADRAYMPNGGSIQNNLSGSEDTQDATWEFWVKPANTTSVMTLFESGGGTGFGFIIDNGVLKAATELDGFPENGSYVSYDLVADTLGLVGGDPTTEFNQYVAAIDIGGGGIALYVNGVKVDETTSGTGNDWDGGDAAGLGIFGGTNHGGFINGALTNPTADPIIPPGYYDATFLGQMAIVRLYSGLLNSAQIAQNFKAVNGDTDIDGDTIVTTGVIDSGDNFVAIGSPAALASGAIVTMNDATGGFDYNPNGAFSLAPGQTVMDTFSYQVTDGNGATSIGEVMVPVTGVANPIDDNLLAKEGQIVTYTPNELLKNDEFVATPGAYINLPSFGLSGGTWTNTGSGVGFDGTITGSIVTAPALTSGFQMIGSGSTATNLTTLDPISTGDATIEIWFKPDAGQTGKSTVFETGGNGNGFSIVFDADTNEVIANFDGGDDSTAGIVATAGGISTSEFNQVIVLIEPNAGDEVAGSPGVFEDLLTVYVNNDPLAGFDATVDGSGVNSAGLANDWAGTDLGGLNATQGTTAFNENFAASAGLVAMFRVYNRVLTPTEMEANFDSAINSITGVGSPTSSEGATVTLNPDGTVSVDYTGISLATGAFLNDSFTYTTSGGTATANVTIEGNTIQEDWRLLYYGNANNTGAGADDALAANGQTNLVNFAADLDPTDATGALEITGGAITTLGPPQVWTDPADGKIYFRYTRRSDFAAIPLTLTEQFSPNVEDYEDNTVAPIVVATGTGASGAAIEAVVVEFPLILPGSGRKARFARLQVTAP